MYIELLPDADAAARRAAAFIAGRALEAVRERGCFLLALSGGETPLPMFEALAAQPLPWRHVELFQVDERIAAKGSAARNWTRIEQLLVAPLGLAPQQLHPIPVEAVDPAAAAAQYNEMLLARAGTQPTLDLVHLGLGADGHTASLFQNDAALDVDTAWVSATGVHHGHRRITLTLPALRRARCILWLVCGEDKSAMLSRLTRGDATIPAGRVPADRAWVMADETAGRLRTVSAQVLR